MPHQRKQLECRRRTGCFQCKQKHLKCTEEKPRCRRCQRLGLDCARGLKLVFKEDAIQRGIRFGREGTWTKHSVPQKIPTAVDSGESFRAVPLDLYRGRWVFLNLTYNDFFDEKHHDIWQDKDPEEPSILFEGHPNDLTDDNMSSSSSLLSCSRAVDHPLSFYPETESYLLSYFIEAIGPNCSLSLSYNPYISLVTPLCFCHTTLRNALLAVAANQLRLLGDVRFEKEACFFKDRALHGLQQAIMTDNLDYGAIGTVLMLCFHDISDGCNPSWVTHLRGGLKLIDHISSRSNECEPLRKFFTMYFVAHDIMNRTAFENWYEDPISHGWLEVDDLDEIDMIMGCSRNLMTWIDKISAIASEKQKILKSRPFNPIEAEKFSSASYEVETSLRFLKQNLPSHSADRDDLNRVAETKRLAALLYLGERLDLEPSPANDKSIGTLDPDTEALSQGTAYSPTRLCKRRLVSSLIDLLSTLPHSATLLWPLFVLGNAGLDNEDHRRFVLDRLEHIQRPRNLGSVRCARLAVKRSFCVQDLDYPSGRIWGHHKSAFISLA